MEIPHEDFGTGVVQPRRQGSAHGRLVIGMTDAAWRELYKLRFSDLPFDCGNANDPGIIYGPDLRDWSTKATTPDQYRIERYIDRFDLRDKRLLHVGIGNSGLAKRFHGRVKEIVGTTIDEPDIRVAQALSYPNYSIA